MADDNFWSLTEVWEVILNVTLHGLRRFLHFCNGHNYDKSFSVNIKSIFLRRPIPQSECCKRGQKLGNDDDFASYIDLPDVQRWKAGFRSLPKRKMDRLLLLATIKETASASSIGNMSKIMRAVTRALSFILQNST